MISTLKRIQAKKAAQENNGGFTLIELLIVIVVLGILAAVVVFSLGGVTGSSAVAACEADGATVSTAIAALAAQSPGVTPILTSGTAAGDLATTYLQSIPNNIQHYQFGITSDGKLVLHATTGTVLTNPVGETDAVAITAGGGGWTNWNGAASCGTAGANVK